MPSTTADIVVAQPDANNDDARSTSSTLVSGEGKPDDETDEQSQTPTAEQVASHLNATSLEDPISNVRHGFDDQIYEEELIRYMYYTERRHETDGKPSNSTTGALQDWVK
jgi:regulator-associated protein of mTOR